MNNKIKCIVSENGSIIPIHNISKIAGEPNFYYVWANNTDNEMNPISNETYNKLLNELKIL